MTRIALAHTTGLSTSDVTFTNHAVQATINLAGPDLQLALKQMEKTRTLDAAPPVDSKQTEGSPLDRLRTFGESCLLLEFDGRPGRPAFRNFTMDERDNIQIQVSWPGERPDKLSVRGGLFAHLPDDHMHFTSVRDVGGELLGNKMMSRDDALLEITCPAGERAGHERPTGFLGFLKLGVEHIWTGYDHLLFLLALLLVCSGFASAVQVLTCFTVAHSITLGLATLNLAWVSGEVVEPMIAASIIYVGVENLIRPEGPKGRWLITFVFGLVHGFGFASVLRDLGVSSSGTGVGMPLLAFNLGVELGQVVIAAVLIPVLMRLRNWKPYVRWGIRGGSAVVIAAGGFWLVQRVFFG